MADLDTILSSLSEPRSKKAKGDGKGKGARTEGRASSSGGAGDNGVNDTLQKLLRLTLGNQSTIRTTSDALSFVCLIIDEDTKQELYNLKEAWHKQRPQASEAQKESKQWPQHPMGCSRKVLLFKYLLRTVLKSNRLTPQQRTAAEELEKLSDAQIEGFIADIKSRFPAPKEGRKWVWTVTMTAFATDAFTGLWANLINLKTDLFELLQAHSSITGLEKELWTKLPKRQ